jgi:transposase
MIRSHPPRGSAYDFGQIASAVRRRLISVPGVGPVVALTYTTGIDDPARFTRSRDIGPHFGLIPAQIRLRRDRPQRLDHQGRRRRCARSVVQAALTLLTRDRCWCALKAWGVAVAKRRRLHRAMVAVARKLAVILHRIWVDDTTFTWSHKAPAAKTAAA